MLNLNLFNRNKTNPKSYKQISGGSTIIGTISFKITETTDLHVKKYQQYDIHRHNNGLYTFTNDMMENVVISKGSLRYNKKFMDIIFSRNIENINIVNLDNEVYFN